MVAHKVVIGTRGNPVALAQAYWVADQLRNLSRSAKMEVKVIRPATDHIAHAALSRLGDKSPFVREIEVALSQRKVDVAVHSMKHLPGQLADGLTIAAIPKRQDPGDALISRSGPGLLALPPGSLLGISSPLQQAQLAHSRPDLELRQLRGNLDSRLRKLDAGKLEALVVGAAEANWLNQEHRITEKLPLEICLPAPGQGAIGIEVRSDSKTLLKLVAGLDHPASHQEVIAERSLLTVLQSAQSAAGEMVVGAAASVDNGQLYLQAIVGVGSDLIRDSVTGPATESAKLGRRLAQHLLDQGVRELLGEIEEGT